MNEVVLSNQILAELYGTTLINLMENPSSLTEDQNQHTVSGPIAEPDLVFLGGNKKNISLLVQTVTGEIPAFHLQFLSNLLKACRLSMEDVAIHAFSEPLPSIQSIKMQLAPRELLLFGSNPVSIGIPINFPPFKIQSYDSINYLYLPNIEEINQDNDAGKLLKSKLWVCLKQLFQV